MAENGGGTSESRRQLVLVPYPLQGHVNPMLQLGTILHSHGFPILIAFPHPQLDFPNTSNRPGFVFHPLLDTKPEASDDVIGNISNIERCSREPLQDLLTQIVNKQEELRPCVVYDQSLYFARTVADEMKLPSIALQTTSAAFMHSIYEYPRLHEEGHLPVQESKLQELVPGLHPLRFKDLWASDFGSLEALLELLAKTINIGISSAMIWNSLECLENSTLSKLQEQFKIPMFAIGPMHKIAPTSSFSFLKEDNSCISWLDQQSDNSVIYVSFGSLACIKEKDMIEIAWGLANSKQPFLWVIRPGSVSGLETDDLLLPVPDDIIESVGERGRIVKWAPQREVLAHKAVGGFWSHCGWNSIMESISEGVPMICTSFGVDQPVHLRYVSRVWGFGFEVENGFERGVVEKAVKRLMADEEGKALRQKAVDLKEKAELSLRKGGTSYNSLKKLIDFIMSI